jgi:glycosyltransferase involved in cell wall biosynthesis
VKILGWTEPSELFAASDLILSTSENEGMPIALIEAQLAGLPVVATDAGSVAEVILDGQTGFVTAKECGALIQACKKLLQDPQLRREMSTNARIHAQEYFSIAGMVAAHVSMYNELMK